MMLSWQVPICFPFDSLPIFAESQNVIEVERSVAVAKESLEKAAHIYDLKVTMKHGNGTKLDKFNFAMLIPSCLYMLYVLFLSLHEYYLSNWLGQQEEIHRIVVYQSDSWMSEWTKRCIRQVHAVSLTFLCYFYSAIQKERFVVENWQQAPSQKFVSFVVHGILVR